MQPYSYLSAGSETFSKSELNENYILNNFIIAYVGHQRILSSEDGINGHFENVAKISSLFCYKFFFVSIDNFLCSNQLQDKHYWLTVEWFTKELSIWIKKSNNSYSANNSYVIYNLKIVSYKNELMSDSGKLHLFFYQVRFSSLCMSRFEYSQSFIQIVVKNMSSNVLHVWIGVPQGRDLGPLLLRKFRL